MSDLVERLRNYPYEACKLAADRIAELEAELKLADEGLDFWQKRSAELEAQLSGFPYPEAGTTIDCEYLVSKYAPKELATFVIADWLRAEQVEAKLNQVDELLFRMDELLTNPVDIDGLNELFCNLRKALADKPEE